MTGAIPKPKILLVEDDIALATAYKVRLEAENFDIRHCPNGEEAMQVAIEYRPDLILLDLMMPRISGFDVLDILRNTPDTANTKIIILTALSQQSDQQRAKDLGANDYLVKSQAVVSDVVKRIRFQLGIPEPVESN
jgi:two-component system phosphate regulon response regulator PhoB